MPRAIPSANSPGPRPTPLRPRPRPRSQPHRDFLNSRAWRATSLAYRAEHPLCEDCKALGVLTPAAQVHHKIKPDARPDLAFDWDNLLALCVPCHGVRTARGE